jgi:hypothetical protein
VGGSLGFRVGGACVVSGGQGEGRGGVGRVGFGLETWKRSSGGALCKGEQSGRRMCRRKGAGKVEGARFEKNL